MRSKRSGIPRGIQLTSEDHTQSGPRQYVKRSSPIDWLADFVFVALRWQAANPECYGRETPVFHHDLNQVQR